MILIRKNLKERWICSLLSGEQISASLTAMAFESLKIPAISLNAFQVKIITDSNFGDAKILKIETDRIKKELDDNKIVVITGFQGIDENNNYTTLGRGGSDTTAVALAATLNADTCEIYTDVNGVYTADPNVVKNAIKLDRVSYDEMLEFSNCGAGVLHNKCVKIAKDNNVKLVVKSSMSDESGTIISNYCKKDITGVTSNYEVVSVIGNNLNEDLKMRITDRLNEENIKYKKIEQTSRSVSITVNKQDVNSCVNSLHNLFF